METTKNKLSPQLTNFFKKMSDFLNTTIYYYGSIQRLDYFPNQSDIDVAIYSDNVYSTINMLQAFLHIKKEKINRIVCKINNNVIYGYKLKYSNKMISDVVVEIAIYDNKFKNIIQQDFIDAILIPTHILVLLYIVKFLHYRIHIIDESSYVYCKKYIIDKLCLSNKKIFITY